MTPGGKPIDLKTGDIKIGGIPDIAVGTISPVDLGDHGWGALPPFIEEELLIKIDPRHVSVPSASNPLGLTMPVIRRLLALVPLELAEIRPIVRTRNQHWWNPQAYSELTPDAIKILQGLVTKTVDRVTSGTLSDKLARRYAGELMLRFNTKTHVDQAVARLQAAPTPVIQLSKGDRVFPTLGVEDDELSIDDAGGGTTPPPDNWWKTRIGISGATATAMDTAPVSNIAVLDSGADPNHPALGDALSDPDGRLWNWTKGDLSDQGHGTHVASIIAGRGVNDVAPGALPAGKVCMFGIFKDGTSIDMDKFRLALDTLREYPGSIRVVNMSIWMLAEPSWHLKEAFLALERNQIVLVLCAGNSPRYHGEHRMPKAHRLVDDENYAVDIPARVWPCLAVGATSVDVNRRWPGSRFSTGTNDIAGFYQDNFSLVDIVAPGQHIVAAKKGGSANGGWKKSLSGTSMAAPMVTAAIGYLQSQPHWANATAEQLRFAIRKCVAVTEDVKDPATWVDPAAPGNEGSDPTMFYGSGQLTFQLVALEVERNPETVAAIERYTTTTTTPERPCRKPSPIDRILASEVRREVGYLTRSLLRTPQVRRMLWCWVMENVTPRGLCPAGVRDPRLLNALERLVRERGLPLPRGGGGSGDDPWDPYAGGSGGGSGDDPWDPYAGGSGGGSGDDPWDPYAGGSGGGSGDDPWDPYAGGSGGGSGDDPGDPYSQGSGGGSGEYGESAQYNPCGDDYATMLRRLLVRAGDCRGTKKSGVPTTRSKTERV